MSLSGGRYLPGRVPAGAAPSIVYCLSLLCACRCSTDLTATIHRLSQALSEVESPSIQETPAEYVTAADKSLLQISLRSSPPAAPPPSGAEPAALGSSPRAFHCPA
jgi:hypothetical protein